MGERETSMSVLRFKIFKRFKRNSDVSAAEIRPRGIEAGGPCLFSLSQNLSQHSTVSSYVYSVSINKAGPCQAQMNGHGQLGRPRRNKGAV